MTGYVLRRDAGPLTSFQAQISDTNLFYAFTGLTQDYYRVQVAAVNSIGQGPWSETATFYTADQPGEP